MTVIHVPSLRKARLGDSAGTARLNSDLLQAAYDGSLDGVREAIANGADVDTVHEKTGLSALHLAIGTNNQQMAARVLGELGRIADTLRIATAAGRVDANDPHVAAAFRDLAEMRTVCFLAMGREP